MNKAIFLDRDGVINIDKGYVHKIEDFIFKEGIFEVCKYLKSLGYLLIVVTNQSGIARGYYTLNDFKRLTDYMLKEFYNFDIKIDSVYFCPHSIDQNCNCRKPKPGMILEAQKEFDIDLSRSWLIGDKESDIEAAKNGGINQTILVVDNNMHNNQANYAIKELKEIFQIIQH